MRVLQFAARAGPAIAAGARRFGGRAQRMISRFRSFVSGSSRGSAFTNGAPSASNAKLNNVIGNLFKASDQIPGGTAGAIRHTARTGDLVGGTNHVTAGVERVRALGNVLRSQNLNGADRRLAQELRDDLLGALAEARQAAAK